MIYAGYEWVEITSFSDLPKRVFLMGKESSEEDTPIDKRSTLTPVSYPNRAIVLEVTSERQMTPTKRGIERFPPDGYYDGDPCTCKESCDFTCTGSCGCEACGTAYCEAMEWLEYD